MVAESLRDRKLHLDYPDLLDMCRIHGISSYTLHQIIEQSLVKTETDSDEPRKSIGFVRLKTPVKVVSEEPKAAPRKAKEEPRIEYVRQTVVTHRWGWKTWLLFIFLASFLLSLLYIIATHSYIRALILYHYKSYIY